MITDKVKQETVLNLIDKLQYFDYDKVLDRIRKTVKKPGILVAGATGAGKSSLINHLFGMEVATEGSGKPVTDRVTRYEPEKVDVVLYDTRGYEIGDEKAQQFYKEVVGYVKEANESKDVKNHIHLVWYCISAANKRVTPMDLDIIASLQGLAKVCIVLTQIDTATVVELKEMRDTIAKKLPDMPAFGVSIDPRVPAESQEWDEMLDWSMDNLESGMQLALAQALGKELRIKRMQADKLVHRYVIAAAGAVVCPLPMTDSAVLVAIQTTHRPRHGQDQGRLRQRRHRQHGPRLLPVAAEDHSRRRHHGVGRHQQRRRDEFHLRLRPRRQRSLLQGGGQTGGRR